MKKITVLFFLLAAISILPMPAAGMDMPKDSNIIEPDPSLPQGLKEFWGKWEGDSSSKGKLCVIVEKIDLEKASLYLFSEGGGWERVVANVVNERGKYAIWFRGRRGANEFTVKGDKMEMFVRFSHSITFKRVLFLQESPLP